MNNRKFVVKALKAMSVPVDWDTTEAIQTYTSSLYRENDRGVIILNGSTIELLLDSQLQKHMSHLNAEERDYLFGFNGPIGTFSSKIRIANALGLISRQVLHKIDLIREMRNACAHSRQEVSFQTEAIYEAVVHLVHDLRIQEPNKSDNGDIRNTFMIAGLLLMATVMIGSIEEAHDQLAAALRQGQGA